MHPLRAWTTDDLRRRRTIKWSLHGPDVLPLWVAEMDAPLAPSVLAVLGDVATTGDLGYPTGEGYAEAFGGFARDRWGWDPPAGLAVHDVMAGVVQALRLAVAPGDAVVTSPPVYPPFHDAVTMVGGRPVHVPLGDDWRLDLDRLESAFAEHAGRAAYLLCNPHNPTSIAPSRDELTTLAALARRHGVRVVSDEIHAPLTDPAGFTPYLSVPDTEPDVVATSASKAWNLAGAKAGLLLGGTPGELAGLPELVGHGASTVGIAVQTAAWNDGREWLDTVRADLVENRALLADLVAQHLPRARPVIGEASYIAWLDLRDHDLGPDPAAVLLDRAQVALGAGPPFGSGEGCARVVYATTPEVLTEAFERIGAVVD